MGGTWASSLKSFWHGSEDVRDAQPPDLLANVLPRSLAHPQLAHGNTKLHPEARAHSAPYCIGPGNHLLQSWLQAQDGLETLLIPQPNPWLDSFDTDKLKLVADWHLPNKKSPCCLSILESAQILCPREKHGDFSDEPS